MKKITTIILTLVLVLSLAACNNGGEGGISQAEADRLQGEIDRLQDELDKARGGSGGSSPYSSAVVGDIIQFGGFDWIVLTVENNQAFILSEKILEKNWFSSPSDKSNKWSSCDLREYLNGSFYNSTFSEQEKEMIAETRLTTASDERTDDKIFLLSVEEVNEYMGDNSHINVRNARIAEHLATGEIWWWWLRSPGNISICATSVLLVGNIDVDGLAVHDRNGGVRPALWLNLE